MSKSSALILLGVLTVLTPFSGLPASFRDFLTVVFGILVLAVGFLLRAKEVAEHAAATPVPPADPTPAPVEKAPEPTVVMPEEPVTTVEPPHTISPI